MDSKALIAMYFEAFNSGETDRVPDLLHDGVEHGVDQGETRNGRKSFDEFNSHTARYDKGNLTDMVIFPSAAERRTAVKLIINGSSPKTGQGLPPARGQRYRLPAGMFFGIRNGKISRVTTYFNQENWTKQACRR